MKQHINCIICNYDKLTALQGYEKAHLCQCDSCDLVFSKVIPTSEELGKYYKNYGINNYLSPLTIKRYNELLDQFEPFRKTNKILDIGCGWGGFAYYAAKNYKVNVVGITISKEQHEVAKKRCNGLNVEIRFQDYRDIDEQFDRIVSIGMLEHVGHKNYTTFMETINKNLNDTGICLLHFIGGNETNLALDSWVNKYIFPNGLIPSLAQIGKAMENRLIIEDLQNIGNHYDKTLMAWYINFKNSWNEIKENYNNTFYLKWIFYLMSSAASFRSRRLSLWQIVIRKPGLLMEYESVRF